MKPQKRVRIDPDPGGRPRQSRILVVTGTDTGVGKTIVSGLLVRALRSGGIDAVGLKPLCSGGREDAVALREAGDGALDLKAVNPWFFTAPLTPLLAARRAGVSVKLPEVLRHIRRVARCFEWVVVEGAGGLMSPLGEDFDTRDLIRALRAAAIIVCPNRLGAINQSLLVWEALPPSAQARAKLVLVNPAQPDASSRSNATLLRQRLGTGRVVVLPWLSEAELRDPRIAVRRQGRRLLRTVLG